MKKYIWVKRKKNIFLYKFGTGGTGTEKLFFLRDGTEVFGTGNKRDKSPIFSHPFYDTAYIVFKVLIFNGNNKKIFKKMSRNIFLHP